MQIQSYILVSSEYSETKVPIVFKLISCESSQHSRTLQLACDPVVTVDLTQESLH